MAFVGRSSRMSRTPMKGALSMPRELSATPAISRLGSTVHTPHIQKCRLEQYYDEEHPLERMTITFEDENLTVSTSSLLGKGGFGKVFTADSNGGEPYALKVSSKRMADSDWKRLREEVTLMSHFSRHPNIVKFYAAGRDEERAYVLMERCASRSLHDVIADRPLNTPEILWIGYSLVNTIAYIHSKGCIHRDLKPQNLLFDADGNLKVTDFGLSSRISEAQPRKTVAGTAMYMAPEMAEEVFKRMAKLHDSRQPLSYGDEVDTWSIGVVLYVLLTRMNPYLDAIERKGARQLDREHKSLALFDAVASAKWSWPNRWHGDAGLCTLVENILAQDPKERWTLQEVLESPLWNRRPSSCPLSLLQKLGLLETSSANRALVPLAENAPLVTGKRTAGSLTVEAVAKLESIERRARTQLLLEYQETFTVLFGILNIARAEADHRESVSLGEQTEWAKLRSQAMTRRGSGSGRRGGSVSLVSDGAARETLGRSSRGGSRSLRTASVSLLDQSDEADGNIVRASPGQYAMEYPGRDTATRWNLRPVVSIPRELNESIEEDFRCMNRHAMTKLTSMPPGYNGFDCNVCDCGIVTISAEKPAFRCYKCDYDVCMKCAYSGRFKDVNFVCVTCARKFPSAVKLQGHSLRCRGPSESPSPRRSSRMNTMLWEETNRRSLLEVQLPDSPKNTNGRGSRRSSARPTYGRTSSGGRISIGDGEVPSPEDMGGLVREHGEADFPRFSVRKSGGGGGGAHKSGRGRSSSGSDNDNLSFDLPPQVSVPARDTRTRAKPRSSAELRDLMREDGGEADGTNPSKRRALDGGAEAVPEHEINEDGRIVGIVARRRAESVDTVHPAGAITIRADNAERPREMARQPHVPRSASSSRAAQQPPPPASARADADVANWQAQRAAAAILPQVPRGPARRAASISGHTAQGGPPLPHRGPAAPQAHKATAPAQPRVFQTALAVPPKSFQSIKQSRYSMPNAGMTGGMAMRGPTPSRAALGGGVRPAGGGAFLALPRDEHNRQQFMDEFLRGGWVRFYSFTQEDTVVMYYCLQPGRYGAMFPTEAGVGTAVVDIFSKLVLYVPCMNNESTNRSQPHPHVVTFYDEEVRILTIAEAQRHLGGVLRCITGFVDEITRLKIEGLTPAAVHAAYIHHSNMESVPRDTKFAYIRKVFPDPSGSFTLFRLSNLRSQVVCNAMMDIRWQSDRRHHVGQKYYVHADGATEPFVVDNTGILSQVEDVLNNNFRR